MADISLFNRSKKLKFNFIKDKELVEVLNANGQRLITDEEESVSILKSFLQSRISKSNIIDRRDISKWQR